MSFGPRAPKKQVQTCANLATDVSHVVIEENGPQSTGPQASEMSETSSSLVEALRNIRRRSLVANIRTNFWIENIFEIFPISVISGKTYCHRFASVGRHISCTFVHISDALSGAWQNGSEMVPTYNSSSSALFLTDSRRRCSPKRWPVVTCCAGTCGGSATCWFVSLSAAAASECSSSTACLFRRLPIFFFVMWRRADGKPSDSIGLTSLFKG